MPGDTGLPEYVMVCLLLHNRFYGGAGAPRGLHKAFRAFRLTVLHGSPTDEQICI